MKADTKLKKEIGARFKLARMYRGLRQADLAEALGVHDITVSKWERGIQTPDADVIYRMCMLLGVSSDFLLGLSDDLGGRNAQV